MRTLTLTLSFLYTVTYFSQNIDTIKVYFIGEFPKKESYEFKYNKKNIRVSVANGFYVDSFKIVINKNEIKPYHFLPLSVLKGKGNTFYNTKLYVLYEPNKKILLIERSYRLKDEYAVNYRWLDKKRAEGILPELYDKLGIIVEDDLSPPATLDTH